MSTEKEIKINKLLQKAPHDAVWLASWLVQNDISHDLQKRYVKSGWLEKIGTGAFKRKGEDVDWLGGVYAIQKQAHKSIHIGGLTALNLQGFAHYLRSSEEYQLFSPKRHNLPEWFKDYHWNNAAISLYRTSFLGNVKNSLQEYEQPNFTVTIASPERAILEALYLCPKKADLVEVYQIFEGMVNLRPKVLQALLEDCSSVKVKRLFFYMAKKADHQWRKFLNLDKIDLGKGKRSLDKGWLYINEYNINVPKELDDL